MADAFVEDFAHFESDEMHLDMYYHSPVKFGIEIAGFVEGSSVATVDYGYQIVAENIGRAVDNAA